ncbi:SMI1/KNR4 family protein [Sorangium cellulosum]|uniref:SMI1/KNR4 family protein n=1 Tax=Sorangium cellulosum TaxID=56 RepID=UPI0009D72BE8|nr:SMI1/KNR4 family protein [Sorangium cellulosum]
MTKYTDVVARLIKFDDRELGTGASEDQIAAAERVLGAQIVGGYRLFLKQFGWGGVGHFEIYGLGPDTPPHLDIVHITQSERHEMEPRLPRHLLPIMNDGCGNLHCLDTMKKNEPNVVLWAHERASDQEPESEAEDFASWLDHMLDSLE